MFYFALLLYNFQGGGASKANLIKMPLEITFAASTFAVVDFLCALDAASKK